jgi:endonuclease III
MTLKEQRIKILEILENKYKGTETMLIYDSPFQLLVSTLLAAQTTDKQVNKIMVPFYKEFPDAESISKLPLEFIEDRISSIGLYRNKSKNMKATAEILYKEYNGNVPNDQKKLEALPGVGRKTANVVRSIAFGEAAIAVDTHVFRVSNRLALAKADNVLKTEEQLMKNIPKEKWSSAHHWLIWHGRNICKAAKPLCDQCPLTEHCRHFKLYKDEILYWKGK